MALPKHPQNGAYPVSLAEDFALLNPNDFNLLNQIL
jgi:hypothetical protein